MKASESRIRPWTMLSPEVTQPNSGLRLQTTVRLRWVAVVGQMLTVFIVYWGLVFNFPVGLCMAVVALSALLNVVLTLRFPASKRLSNKAAMLLLGYDILQLVGLLYLTGGLENPFALLMVVPVAVAASTMPLIQTAILAGLAIVSASLLVWFHLPLPWAGEPMPVLPSTYVIGSWAALASCIAFSAVYSWRVGRERRQMSEALAAAEIVLAREQRLSALDGLAAAAAHELGTPLGTITVVAKELLKEVPDESPIREDISLLHSQATRCRDILGRLANRSEQGDEMFERLSLGHLLEEVVDPHRQADVDIEVRLKPSRTSDGKLVPQPITQRNPGIIYGLGNLVENAVDFARNKVVVTAQWDTETVRVTIADDGPGFSTSIISRLGEPYVTTRAPIGHNKAGEQAGMGLGFFIAKTLLERSGARLELRNENSPKNGAMVTVIWRRHDICKAREEEPVAV